MHRNTETAAAVREAVLQLTGSAVVVDTGSGRVFDLTREPSRTEGIERLVWDRSGRMELFATRREDRMRMLGLMAQLVR